MIITGSETLTELNKKKIKEKFINAYIIETYGSTECIQLGTSCKYGTLHINEDLCILELIDDELNLLPFKEGIISDKILVTNLINTYQPVIRYVLDDSVEILPPCICGSKLTPVKVHGRTDDIIYLIDDMNRFLKIIPLSLESSIFLKVSYLKQWQVIHTKQNQLMIIFVCDDKYVYNLYNEIKINLEEYLIRNLI